MSRTESYQKTMESKRKFPEWFIDELNNEEDRERARKGKVLSSEMLEFLCKEHGVYIQKVGNHIRITTGQRGQGCPVCGELSRSKSKSNYYKSFRVIPVWLKEEMPESEYVRLLSVDNPGDNDYVFICKEHGEYRQRLYNHVCLATGERKSGCPKCYEQGRFRSKMEDEIASIFIDAGIKVERNVKGYIRNKETGRFYEIDIMVPDMRLAIEVNGSYWHCTGVEDEKRNKEKFYHQNKMRLCKENGIHLISIFDVDWEIKKDKITDYLKGLINKKREYARKLSVKEVFSKEAKEFCDRYHLQGGTGASICLGLFKDEELLSVMTFVKPRFGNTDCDWEIKRYCTKEGITIVGGAAKLFSYFSKDHVGEKILSYSDCDYFTGDIYKQLGFDLMGYTEPSYYWWSNGDVKVREDCQLFKLKEKYPNEYKESEGKGNRENYIMSSLGYIKVYRTGNKRWEKIISGDYKVK